MAKHITYPNLEPLLREHATKGLVEGLPRPWAAVVGRVWREAVTEVQDQIDCSQETAATLLCVAANLCVWPEEDDPCPTT